MVSISMNFFTPEEAIFALRHLFQEDNDVICV